MANANTGTLIAKGMPAPVRVTSPAQLRTAQLPFSQSLARDIEGLAQNLVSVHTLLSTKQVDISAIVVNGRSVADVLVDVTAISAAVAALSQQVAKGTLVLLVNGEPTGKQSRLNLVKGQNITISDDGQGNLTIAAQNGTRLALSTNGARNGSQNALNLEAGPNISVVDNGQGGVTIGSSAAIRTITANYAALPSDSTILVDATAGAVTVLLNASATTGALVNVKKIDSTANAVTIDGNGNVVEGAATIAFSQQWVSLTAQYDGSASWWLI